MGWDGGTTHLAFGEVAGTEGSFHPLAVSRKHLEKTEGAEKGTRQREGSDLERSWAEMWEESWGNSLLHRNLPLRIELHLELYQAGGAESSSLGPGAGTCNPAHQGRAGRHLHFVQEGAATGIGCQRVLDESQYIFSPVLQDPRAWQSEP